MATLIVTEGPASGQQFALAQHRLVLIGRDHDCTFQILDRRMSRHHCQLKYDPAQNQHSVVDFESSNGVILNGKKVIDNQPILGCTNGALHADETIPGPLYLQGDHTAVSYRNIVLYPVVK